MSASALDRVTVLGAGVLGSQIAWHSAYMGKQVVLFEPMPEGRLACERALATYEGIYRSELGASEQQLLQLRSRLSIESELSVAVSSADLVIEAVPEVPKIKHQVYRQLASLLPERTLVASNSSTLLCGDFADDVGCPERLCSLHFANLIWKINIAELMAHERTDISTVERVTQFAVEIGMVPIAVKKPTNGYVLNSLLVPLANAAQTLITQGVADAQTIDRTYMIMNRGCAAGPCAMMDVVGFNTIVNIFSHWGQVQGDSQMLANADYLKREFLDKGKLGLQSGEGYYRYPEPSYEAVDFLEVPDISLATRIAEQVCG